MVMILRLFKDKMKNNKSLTLSLLFMVALFGSVNVFVECATYEPMSFTMDSSTYSAVVTQKVDPESPTYITMFMDSKTMRRNYLVSTDKVFTDHDARSLIHAVSSTEGVRLEDAVHTIVNLKLIRRLHFPEADSVYKHCKGVTKDGEDSVTADCVEALENSESKKAKAFKSCTAEQCQFYANCVLSLDRCSSDNLETATLYLLNQQTMPYAAEDDELDELIAKAVVYAQFAPPFEAIKVINGMMEGQPMLSKHIGLIQAKALAISRSGLHPKNMPDLLSEVNLASSLEPKNLDCIYRRASVLLSYAHFFDALEEIENGLDLYPNFASFHEMKGSAHFQLQELAQAETWFRSALQNKVDNNQETMQKLGLVLYRQGKLSNAIAVYKELLKLAPDDVNTLVSIAHVYRQQGDGKNSLKYAKKAIKLDGAGKIPLMFRGSLYHLLGRDLSALADLEKCMELHPYHELCLYNLALVYATLGRFYDSIRSLVGVIGNVDVSSNTLQSNSHYVKSSYLINYFRYLHSKLDKPLSELDLEKDLCSTCRDGWAKGAPLETEEFLSCEQKGISPDIEGLTVPQHISQYGHKIHELLCTAYKYGNLMQVKADSFIPNRRFNVAMGLAAIHTAQHLRQLWATNKKHVIQKLGWREMFSIALPYRRLAELETPIIWLGDILKDDENMGYHNEVSFYRGQVKNLRMKSYFDLVFELTRSMISQQVVHMYPSNKERKLDVERAKTPEELVSAAKNVIPTQISTNVPSSLNGPKVQLEGGMIVLTELAFGGAALYMNIPTALNKTLDYDNELAGLMLRMSSEATKVHTKNVPTDDAVAAMLTLSYYWFNLCPLSRGSASVGYATLVGMFLSIDQEVTSPLSFGKMLDMEATLSGGPDTYIIGTKSEFKLQSLASPVTDLPLVKDVFPTTRSLLEVLALEELRCSF